MTYILEQAANGDWLLDGEPTEVTVSDSGAVYVAHNGTWMPLDEAAAVQVLAALLSRPPYDSVYDRYARETRRYV